jgi:uroporphyrinogen decarboxylase
MSEMTPRERVLAVLNHELPDQIPRFEVWIDALQAELGCVDSAGVYAAVGQDCVMMPSRLPEGSNAWRTGVDEWGRVWRDGIYDGGAISGDSDLERYTPPLSYVDRRFDPERVHNVQRAFPEHCLIFGTHNGPFTAGYLAMGFQRFFLALHDDLAFVRRLLEARTEWCIAVYQRAAALGAEILVLGDDAGSSMGPMVPPGLWRELVLPLHRRIVQSLDVPVIWHSDGNVAQLLPMAVEAGFAGVHGLDPTAGMDLAATGEACGDALILVGNLDVRVLCNEDLAPVHAEVDRCLDQGTSSSGYMFATCNSIFSGMKPRVVKRMFEYAEERISQ